MAPWSWPLDTEFSSIERVQSVCMINSELESIPNFFAISAGGTSSALVVLFEEVAPLVCLDELMSDDFIEAEVPAAHEKG